MHFKYKTLSECCRFLFKVAEPILNDLRHAGMYCMQSKCNLECDYARAPGPEM